MALIHKRSSLTLFGIRRLEGYYELCRSYAVLYHTASAQVRLILEMLSIRLVTIGPEKLDFATAAYAHFGKGRHLV